MLKDLIEQARREGKWLWCAYQDLWFSPDQLEMHNAAGRFNWAPVNWKLRDPNERLEEAKRRAEYAEAEVARIRREIS